MNTMVLCFYLYADEEDDAAGLVSFPVRFYGGIFMKDASYPILNQTVNRMAEEKGVLPEAVAIAWILRHPARIQPMAGTTNPEHLKAICSGCGIEPTRAEWYELTGRL